MNLTIISPKFVSLLNAFPHNMQHLKLEKTLPPLFSSLSLSQCFILFELGEAAIEIISKILRTEQTCPMNY